jgi:hypothetical protein
MCRTPQHGGSFRTPQQSPQRGKILFFIPAPIPATGENFIFPTPQTRPRNRIYLISIPGTAIYYYLHRGLR